MASMHQQANPFSPFKSLPFVEDKELVWAQASQACSLKVDNFYGKIIL